MIVDTHCHLDPRVYGDDAAVDAVVARANAAGVTRLVAIGAGYGLEGADHAARVAGRHPGVWFTAGVHPHESAVWGDDAKRTITRLSQRDDCVAVGEMGLDFFYDTAPRDLQRTVLREQVALAVALELPVVVHDRDSNGEVFQIVGEEGGFDGAGVLWHCYSGSTEEMHEITGNGGYISIPGIITFKNAQVMRRVVREAPADRLLVETDSPYLTPAPHRGTQNEPMRVVHVVDKIAELRGVTPDEIAEATTANARRLFGF